MFFLKPVVQFKSSNIDEDFKFLDKMIKENIILFKKTLELDDTVFILEDRFIQESSTEIVANTYSMLSNIYISLLLLYIKDEDKLLEYISNIVVKDLIDFGLKFNSNKKEK